MAPLGSRQGSAICSGIGQDPGPGERGCPWVLWGSLAEILVGENGGFGGGDKTRSDRDAVVEEVSDGYGKACSLGAEGCFLSRGRNGLRGRNSKG